MKKVFILIAFLSIPFLANATGTTYTVCNSGCNYTTIQGAFDGLDLSGDDIVEVRADTPGASKTYSGTVTPGANDSGTSGHPVILRARTGDTINIDGGDTLAYGINLSNVDYFTVGGTSGNGFYFDNFVNITIYGQGAKTGWTVSYNTVNASAGGTATGVRVGIALGGTNLTSNTLVSPIIEHNTVTNDAASYTSSDTDLIRLSSSTGGIIRYNTVTQNNATGTGDNHQDGIQAWSNTNMAVHGNVVHLPNSASYQQGVYLEFYNYAGDVSPTDYGTLLVYDNLVYGYGGSYLMQVAPRPCTSANVLYCPNGANTVPGILTANVYNNTLHAIVGSPFKAICANTTLQNNIFKMDAGSPTYTYSVATYDSDCSSNWTTTVSCDYNHVIPPSGTASSGEVMTCGGSQAGYHFYTWAAARIAGYETNGVGYSSGSWHDPAFVGTGNYNIQTTSPDKYTGTATGQLSSTDITGAAWHSPPSIGAYEYSAGATYTVTGAAVSNGSTSCTSPVGSGSTTTCTLSPATGYQSSAATSDTCTGSLSGNTYTTGVVTSNCIVTAIFIPIPKYDVSGNVCTTFCASSKRGIQ